MSLPMDPFGTLLQHFEQALAAFQDSQAMCFLNSQQFQTRHYASALREIYFYTRENPQLQAALPLAFRGGQRQAVKRILGHALSEVGHDQLALDDLGRLGVDVSGIPTEQPLPSTLPLIAYPLYLLHHRCPVAYLGQIFFLEFLPTRMGDGLLDALTKAGIPQASMTFLAEHAEVDVQHNRLMERHAADLLTSRDDLSEACEAIHVCGYNYAKMLEGSFQAAERFSHLDQLAGAH